jgi:hypothetical protein
MTQEHKDLLLKDLCARLPYGVKGCYQNSDDELLRKVTIMYRYLEHGGMVMTGDIKPYLIPLSSMTEEQEKEEYEICKGYLIGYEPKLIDFYHKNHFDYRGLIPLGLAIDATNLNIY